MNQQTAQGLAALGRGPDSMLVHMAPEEVAGLQALALKHGGTLTINPETGLAEAGFLKNILPMVAGFALNAFAPGVGTAVGGMFGLGSAAGTALTVGGIAGLTSGNLEKGLMAGLGAYGGASLGAGFANAGTGALSSAAGNTAASGVTQAVPVAAPVAAAPSAASASGAAASSAAAPAGMQPLAGVPGKFVTSALPQPVLPTTVTPMPAISAPAAPALTQSAADIGNAYAQEQAAQNAVAKALADKTPTDLLGAGVDAAKNAPGAFLKKNAMPLAALGVAALSGSGDKKSSAPQSPGMIRPYTFSREPVPGAFDRTANDSSSRERQYFNDQYTARTPYKAPGPEYMAAGGPVEAMSNANEIKTLTGLAQFAEGGNVGGYTYDPKTGLYTKPGGQGATTVSPTGGISDLSGAMLDGGGSSTSYVGAPPTTTAAEFAEQSARNQKINDFLTDLTKYSPTNLVFSTLNTLFGTQAPATVVDAGTYAGMYPTSAESGRGIPGESETNAKNDAVDANQGAAVGADMGYAGPSGSDPASDSGRDSGNSGSAPGGGAAAGGLMALAQGGMSNLGGYSDGGRLLRGPGDGVSDSIPAMIGQKQEARLADGEFVVPARIVSELGNGSTEAGARQLYAMMDRVQKARKKTVGKDKVATNSRAAKLLPA